MIELTDLIIPAIGLAIAILGWLCRNAIVGWLRNFITPAVRENTASLKRDVKNLDDKHNSLEETTKVMMTTVAQASTEREGIRTDIRALAQGQVAISSQVTKLSDGVHELTEEVKKSNNKPEG